MLARSRVAPYQAHDERDRARIMGSFDISGIAIEQRVESHECVEHRGFTGESVKVQDPHQRAHAARGVHALLRARKSPHRGCKGGEDVLGSRVSGHATGGRIVKGCIDHIVVSVDGDDRAFEHDVGVRSFHLLRRIEVDLHGAPVVGSSLEPCERWRRSPSAEARRPRHLA